MAALDKILDVMPSAGAKSLSLKAGVIPVFNLEGGTKPVLKSPLQEASLLAYVKEICDPGSCQKIEARQPCTFRYRDFRISVEFGPDGTSAQVVPWAQAVPPAPAKAEKKAAPAVTASAVTAPAGVTVKNEVDALFIEMVQKGASDLHLSVGEPPFVRLDGEMTRLAHPVLTEERMKELLWPVCPSKNRAEFERCSDTDFAYEVEGLSRFRCNFFMDRFGMGGVFRTIPTQVPTVEELGLSKAVVDLCWLSKGLVLVTGPTGSGKSTTLAALADFINRNRTDHIITIEDPIEFVHSNKRCLINQREVSVHTESFKRALRAALREDPDIVLVGEMRDLETIAIAIETAETGHLVFGTLHTTTAPTTVDRVIDQFPADRQSQIRVMLSEALKAVLSQTLCKKIGGGRTCAMEVLIVNSSVANLIREGKTFQIPSIMQTQKALGNITLNDVLLGLVKGGLVSPREAYIKAIDKTGLKALFEHYDVHFDSDDLKA
jgi:twitching motility protein PilT